MTVSDGIHYVAKINANSTNYQVGGDNFDAQWIDSNYSVISNANWGANKFYTYSLSSYLPNDNYDYEIFVTACGRSGSKKGNQYSVLLLNGTVSSSDYDTTLHGEYRMGRKVARTDENVSDGSVAIIPIYANDRNLSLWTKDGSGSGTNLYIWCTGYRRIGKNDGGVTYISKISNGSTSYPIGGKFANGSVVMFTTKQSWAIVSTESNKIIDGATLAVNGATSISLSNVIPNDGYDYEVCLSCWMSLSGADNKRGELRILPKTQTYEALTSMAMWAYRISRTTADYGALQTCWFPISAYDKNITVGNTGTRAISYNICCHGYRRIGKNEYDLLGSYGTNIVKNINSYQIGGYNFDGQWICKQEFMCNGVNLAKNSATTYSLSNYLPNDGYDYLVAFSGWGRTPSGSGSAIYRIMQGTQTYADVVSYGARMMMTEYHSTSTYSCDNNVTLPIFANDRNITFVNSASNATGASGLYAVAYRRLGTNE